MPRSISVFVFLPQIDKWEIGFRCPFFSHIFLWKQKLKNGDRLLSFAPIFSPVKTRFERRNLFSYLSICRKKEKKEKKETTTKVQQFLFFFRKWTNRKSCSVILFFSIFFICWFRFKTGIWLLIRFTLHQVFGTNEFVLCTRILDGDSAALLENYTVTLYDR